MEINTIFHNNKILKEGSQYICLMILINSNFRTDNNYFPQVFLEECKYVVKEKKMSKYIIDDIEISDEENSNEEKSDEGNSNQETSDEENLKNYSYSKVIFKACKKIDKISF